MDKLKCFLSLSDDGEHAEQRSIVLEAVGTFAYGVGRKALRPYLADTMAQASHQDGQRAPPDIDVEQGIAVDAIGTVFAATGHHFLPYIQPSVLQLISHLLPYYEGIQKNAPGSMLEIIRTFYKLGNPQDRRSLYGLIALALVLLLGMNKTEDY